MALRIGINALYLIPGGVGGTEIYLRGLLAALAEIDNENDYFVFTNRETGRDLVPKHSRFHHHPQPIQAKLRPVRIIWEQTALPIEAARLRLDVMFNPGFTSPVFCGCPQVTVFHDLQHKRHPEYFRWFDLPFWRILLAASAQVSRTLLADSETARADVVQHYRLPPEKVVTVDPGVDEEFFAVARRRRPEPFLLAVSTLHPHKNLDGLLRAFARFRCTHPEYRLVVSGLHGFFSDPLHDLRDALGLAGAVDFPGWIPREDLYDLFARASAFVYPSFFEGFGMPILEAMAAGIPSACSNIEPVAGNVLDAALLFDPRDVDAICACMGRLVDDQELRAELAISGPAQAREFSWRTTAHKALKVIKNTARAAY